MQNFEDHKPGKLRSRSSRRRSSQSMLDLPAIQEPGSMLESSSAHLEDTLLSSDLVPKVEPGHGAESLNLTDFSPTDLVAETGEPLLGNAQSPTFTQDPASDMAVWEHEESSGSLLDLTPDEPKTSNPGGQSAGAQSAKSILNQSVSNASLSSLIKKNTHSANSNKLLAQKEAQKTPHKEQSANEANKLRLLINQGESLNRSLTESVHALQLRQLQAERRTFFNSAAAYVLFCIIIALGMYFSLHFKSKAKLNEQQAQIESFKSVLSAKQILEQEFEKGQRASKQAFEVYQLSEQGRYDEALQRFTEVRANLSHPAELALLEERIESIRWKLANNAYRDALAMYLEGNLEQARDAFFKSIAYKKDTPYTHLLNHYLAMCLFNLGDYEGARQHFKEAIAADLPSEMDAISRYNYAVSSEKVGANAEAYDAFGAFLKKYRYHKLADEAGKKQSRLERNRGQSDKQKEAAAE